MNPAKWTPKDVRSWLKEKKTGVIYVIIPGTDGLWKSSGLTDRDEAVRWALRMARGGYTSETTVKEFSLTMFIPGSCDYVSARNDDRWKKTAKHWRELRAILTTIIWPEWGGYRIGDVRPGQFHEWLSALSSTRFPDRRLSPARRAKVLFTAVTVWDWAVFKEVIPQNVLATVPKIVPAESTQDKFTEAERKAMFPADLSKVWKSSRNIVSALPHPRATAVMLCDEGLRPQEALAIYWEDIDHKKGGAIVKRALNDEGEKGLKTSVHAVKKRAVKFSARLLEILAVGKNLTGPLYTQKPWTDKAGVVHRDFLRVDTFGKVFCQTMDQLVERGGKAVPLVDRKGRTLYSLRHTKNTREVTEALEKVRQTMGHTTEAMTQNYDHADEQDLWRREGL